MATHRQPVSGHLSVVILLNCFHKITPLLPTSSYNFATKLYTLRTGPNNKEE
jgi:hypothetical protein